MQFTKQGSIFLCVRLVDPLFYETIPPPSSQRFLDLMDPMRKHTYMNPLNSEPDSATTDAGQHDVTIKGAVAVRSNLFRTRYPQMAPPRLSMKPGPASTAASVAQWRDWKPAGTWDCDEVVLVMSIEDTGTYSTAKS